MLSEKMSQIKTLKELHIMFLLTKMFQICLINALVVFKCLVTSTKLRSPVSSLCQDQEYSVYKPVVQNNTIIADTGSAHKLHSILPKFLPQTSLISLQK